MALSFVAVACDQDTTEPPEPEPAAAATPEPSATPPENADEVEPKAAEPTKPTETVGLTYSIGGVDARLVEAGNTCLLRTGAEGSTQDLLLEVQPPCYWLLWKGEPSSKPAKSGGKAGGAAGEPIQWTYGDVKTTAAMVTGGPFPDDMAPEKIPKMQEHHCGIGWQPLVVKDGEASVLPRKSQSTACERSGADERDYWIAAHPGG